jgi:hypothetical protein
VIKRLIEWFRGHSPAHRKFGRWLRKEHVRNPFVIEGFDCFYFVQSMLSTTTDQNIAASFVTLRKSDGSEYHGKLPDNSVEITCHLEYPSSREIANKRMFKAPSMEQKWDIYLYDNRLYFCRSWTGSLVYVASFVVKDEVISISNIWGDGNIEKEYSIRQVDYLIKSHLYGRRVPHPLPSSLSRDPQVVALYSWSHYGNVCCFGTFEDTLTWNLTKMGKISRGE